MIDKPARCDPGLARIVRDDQRFQLRPWNYPFHLVENTSRRPFRPKPLETHLRWINRTIKDATVKRYFYDTHHQLKTLLTDFLRAYNFARRLKTLKGLTPFEYLCKLWTQEPKRFTLNPTHQMPGLNT